jgi:protein TonB
VSTTRCIAVSLALHASLIGLSARGSAIHPVAPPRTVLHPLEASLAADDAPPGEGADDMPRRMPESAAPATKPPPAPARPATVRAARTSAAKPAAVAAAALPRPEPGAPEASTPVQELPAPLPAQGVTPPASNATPQPLVPAAGQVPAVAPSPPAPSGPEGSGASAPPGTGTSGGVGTSSAGGDGRGQLVARYLKNARARVFQHREYPYIARRANLEGTICLRVSIGAAGDVLAVTPTCGNTNRPLLAAALKSVSRAAPFPPLPAALGRELTFDVPIVFDLDNP